MISSKYIKSLTNFLLAGNKFMLELHLRQPRFNHSVSGPITKHRERIQIFRETGNLKEIYKNEYSNSNLRFSSKTISDKILKDKAYKYKDKSDGYQSVILVWFISFREIKTGL